VKVDTAWVLPPMGDDVSPENVKGLRMQRYALWSVLHREAVRLGVDFVYDCDVTGVDTAPNGNGTVAVVVKTRNGQTYTADLLLACDGSKSAVRAALAPEERLTFLGKVIIGTTVTKATLASAIPAAKPFPPECHEHHGMLLPTAGGSSGFFCDEGNGQLLMSMSFNWPEPLPRDLLHSTDPAYDAQRVAVRKAILRNAENYPSPLREWPPRNGRGGDKRV
jgi:hypothetical protein